MKDPVIRAPSEGERAFIYARVSTERQASHDVSVPDQLAQMRRLCEERQWIIVGEFQDAITASSDRRPAFQEMIDAATGDERPVSVIVVHSFSRIFRNKEDAVTYAKLLRDHKVRIQSLTQPVDESPIGQIMYVLISCMDEWQVKETAKHVRRTLRANAAAGFYNGSTPPFGYKTADTGLPSRSGHKKVLVVDEAEAKIVLLIFDLYENGRNGIRFGGKQVATYLNDNGFRRRDAEWDTNDVWRVLSDRVYIGEYEYGNRRKVPSTDFVLVKVPALIPKEQFNRISVLRHSRSPTKRPPLHVKPASLLTGLIRCGVCNSAMCICTGNSGKYRYFRCNLRNKVHKSACDMPNVPADKLEELVLQKILDDVLTKDRITTLLRDFRTRAEEIQRKEILEYRLACETEQSLTRKLSNIARTIEETGLGPGSYMAKKIIDLERQLEAVRVQLDNLKIKVVIPENLISESVVETTLPGLREQFSDPDSDAGKTLLRLLVKEIKVYRDEVTVSGSTFGVVEALVAGNEGTRGGVPSFIPKWRARRDSNSRPPGS